MPSSVTETGTQPEAESLAGLKVCMVVHQPYFADARVRNYAKSLTRVGAEVDVVCLRSSPDESLWVPGIRVFSIPLSRHRGGLGRQVLEYLVAFVLFSAWIAGLYLRRHYGVIHVHNMPDFLIFTALIPKILGARLILDIHDPMPEVFLSRFRRSSRGLLIWLLTEQEMLSAQFAHAVITANDNFRDNLVKRGVPSSKITVVNNVPDPELFNRGNYKRDLPGTHYHFTLIYVGTIAERYALDVAIRALPELQSRIPRIRLVLIGFSTGYVKYLSELAKSLGVSSLVQIKPPVPTGEVPLHMSGADIGIYTALPDAHMSIATPGKVLEYAAMGIPIVTSRLRVLEDLFPSSAVMFFDPGDETQFARCVLELYEHPERGQELVRKADEFYGKTHTWSREQQMYLDLLYRLLGARLRRSLPVTQHFS